jgi:hypothetical protein
MSKGLLWTLAIAGFFAFLVYRVGHQKAVRRAEEEGRIAPWYEVYFGSSDGDGGG